MTVAALEWQPVVGVVAGAAMVALGIASSRGSFRGWEPWYRDPDMPWFLRNGAFALVPFGIAIIGLMAAAVASSRQALATVGVVIFVFGLITGIVFMIRPPRWIKPPWARDVSVGSSGSR
jgi:hypothetical protein